MSIKPKKVSKQDQQIAELTDALQRERADAINARTRHTSQLTGAKSFTKVQIVRDLLPIIDNLERALKYVPEDIAGHDYIKGVQGVVKLFEKTLKDMEVMRIKTVGEIFNPKYHEAVGMEEGEGDTEVITEELQAGYVLLDEVIRHAMVKVKLQQGVAG